VNQNPEKDPSEWSTGDEPMTGPQTSYLKTLSQEARVEFVESLTKAQASRRIDELQKLTGRGSSPRRGRGATRGKDETKSPAEKESEK
jgi:hypothetical protein